MKKNIVLLIIVILINNVMCANALASSDIFIRYNPVDNTFNITSSTNNLAVSILKNGTADMPVFVRQIITNSGSAALTVDLSNKPSGKYDFYYSIAGQKPDMTINYTNRNNVNLKPLNDAASPEGLFAALTNNAINLGVDTNYLTSSFARTLFIQGKYSDVIDFAKKYNAVLFIYKTKDFVDLTDFSKLLYCYQDCINLNWGTIFNSETDEFKNKLFSLLKNYDFTSIDVKTGFNECYVLSKIATATKWSDIQTLLTTTYTSIIKLPLDGTYLQIRDKEAIFKVMLGNNYTTVSDVVNDFSKIVENQYSKEQTTNNTGSRSRPDGIVSATVKVSSLNVSPAPTAPVVFNDTDEVKWAADAIKSLVEKHIILGYKDNTFKPLNYITRAEFAKILVSAFSIQEIPDKHETFLDVTNDAWYYNAVSIAASKGVILGNGGYFRPNDNVTRQEAAVMLYRVLSAKPSVGFNNFSDDSAIADYAKNAVYSLRDLKIINGLSENLFNPLGTATRAEATVMIYNSTLVGDTLQQSPIKTNENSSVMIGADDITKFIKDEVDKNGGGGIVVQVLKNGETVYDKGFGFANIEKKIPVDSNTIFRIMSMTKPVITAATMLLKERGKLSLDDPISKYIPGFKNQMVKDGDSLVPIKRDATIYDCINNFSGQGFPNGSEIWEKDIALAKEGKGKTTFEIANDIGSIPLLFQPMDKWSYSNSADVMGAVIEIASGKSLGEFLKDEFFSPLGMNDTAFYVPESKYDRLAIQYDIKDGIPTPSIDWHPFDALAKAKPAFESGAAGLYSTTNDYAKFAQMLLDNGTYKGKIFLKKETVDYIRQNRLTPEQQQDFVSWIHFNGYGYGSFMRVLVDAKKDGTNGNVGEYGWFGYRGTYFAVDPTADMVLQVNTQGGGNINEIVRGIRKIVYDNLKK